MVIEHRTATSQNNFKYINLRTHTPIYSYYWFAKLAIIIHFFYYYIIRFDVFILF